MVTHDAGAQAGGWLRCAAFSVIVPTVLFSAYLLVSRVAIPSIKGNADFLAVFASAVAGAVVLWRPAYPRAFKAAFSVIYFVLAAMLLVLYGFSVDCAFFHDCD